MWTHAKNRFLTMSYNRWGLDAEKIVFIGFLFQTTKVASTKTPAIHSSKNPPPQFVLLMIHVGHANAC